MFGNLLGGAEILRLVRRGDLLIKPFDVGKLAIAHYSVGAGVLLRRIETAEGSDAELAILHDFSENPIRRFEGREYGILEVLEEIVLPSGVFGQIIPASSLVLQGFGLTAGKLDSGYGSLRGGKQKMVLGVSNLVDEPNVLDVSQGVAHVIFFDMRGLPSFEEAKDLRAFRERDPRFWRANDDGVYYAE